MEQVRKTQNKTESQNFWLSVLFHPHKSDRNKPEKQFWGVWLIPGSKSVWLILYLEGKMSVWLILWSNFWLILWPCLA